MEELRYRFRLANQRQAKAHFRRKIFKRNFVSSGMLVSYWRTAIDVGFTGLPFLINLRAGFIHIRQDR